MRCSLQVAIPGGAAPRSREFGRSARRGRELFFVLAGPNTAGVLLLELCGGFGGPLRLVDFLKQVGQMIERFGVRVRLLEEEQLRTEEGENGVLLLPFLQVGVP